MPYYPQNRIIANQYTSGGEYQIADNGEEYTGFYYKTFTGQAFTGKNPQVKPSKRLIPKVDGDVHVVPKDLQLGFFTRDANYYNDTTKTKGKNVVISKNELPYYVKASPSENDYVIGEFVRYFYKKRNNTIFIETTSDDYLNTLKYPTRATYSLYKPFKLSWKLTGDPTDVATTNKNIILLTERNQEVLGLSQFLTNYTEFYKDLSDED